MPPREVVRAAHTAGLTGLSLTDHDTIAGCADAADEAAKLGIDFIPGIEISCEYPRPGTMHLLGYGIDPQSPILHDLTRRLIDGRSQRNVKIIESLRAQNVAITLDEVLEQAKGGTVGRPHFAAILVRKGYVRTVQDAFNKYLGQSGSTYVDKETVSPKRAIEMIRESGGLPVLAHPVQLKRENFAQLENTVKELADYGLAGVETIHSDHREILIEELFDLARRYNLIPTGGSDFHGSSKPHIRLGQAGPRKVPRELFDRLQASIETLQAQ